MPHVAREGILRGIDVVNLLLVLVEVAGCVVILHHMPAVRVWRRLEEMVRQARILNG